jgi:limonene 1,2-monooxygenase
MPHIPMKFGLFHGPHHAIELDTTYLFERDMQMMQHLDRLGFDEAWIGEHHSGGFETMAAPEVFISAACERTKYIRFGTGVKSLPYHHPFIVAETMAQLDHMTRGRVIFGAGPGALPSDAQMFGLKPVDQRPRMEEALEVIVPLLRGETVTKKTSWFECNAARLSIGCYTQPSMPLAITSIRSPTGVVQAGKFGAMVLVLGGVDDESLEHHLSNWKIYEDTCAKHGHVADRANWRFTIQMHIAETREQAKKDCEYGLEKWIAYSNDIVPAASPPPRGLPDPVKYLCDNRRAIIGTPDDAVAELERIRDKVGGFGGVLVFAHDWANWPATLRSMELLAEEVRPRINNTGRFRRDSYDRIAPNQDANRAAARQGVAEATARFKAQK